MPIDQHAASTFMATHARPLDRLRFGCLVGTAGDAPALLAATDGYRLPDGGYGRGLEPDLRSATAQPAGALHAFEAMADAAPLTTPHATALCDWLTAATLPGGGLPFALPIPDPAGCAPFWVGADPTVPSLQITAIVALEAHRLARFDAAVAAHPWLTDAVDWCVRTAAGLPQDAFAMELAFALRLLDAVHVEHPDAPAVLDRLAERIPADARLPVAGGLPDEAMRPLDLAPLPGTALRARLDADAVAADLDRLAGLQQDDGGWPVEWQTFSPAAELEWRGHLTVRALAQLQANGRA